jgi:hypothetical protein
MLCLAVGSAVFALILLQRAPNFLRPLGFALRTEFWPVIPIATGIIYFAYRLPGRFGELIAQTAVLGLFALALAGLWAYGHSQTTTLSGLIPMNDARGYYRDALRLSHGEDFSFFASRRPLFVGLLSVLLVSTNFNLMACLAVLTALAAISAHLTAREIQRTCGTETAAFFLMMVFLYYRLHSGTIMSENLGVILGCLGFASLWHGAAGGKVKSSFLWLGLLITTLALNARAGAFLVLPLLILWAGWLFRGCKAASWRAIGVAATAVTLGFVLNLLLVRLIGDPSGIPFANFSYSLYSLAAGGKSWAYIAEVHPEIMRLGEPEHTRLVFRLAFDLMREKPLQAVEGAVFFWRALFSDTLYNLYAYVSRENWTIHPLVKWSLYIFSLAGMFAWIKERKSPIYSLVMVYVLGVFLSVPFAPPTDSFRIRPYAASIAALAALPALGFRFVMDRIKLRPSLHPADAHDLPPRIVASILLLVLAMTAGPLVVRFTAPGMAFPPADCNAGMEPLLIRYDGGTSINLKKNTLAFLDWMPDFHVYLFRKNAHSLEDVHMIEWAQEVPASHTLLVALDLPTQSDVLLLMPTKWTPEPGRYLQLCGRFEDDPDLAAYRIFYAESAGETVR